MMRRIHRRAGIRTTRTGFTLIEVLIVTVMVGLLAALVIPTFLGQRQKAEGATAQALLRSGASAVESASVDSDGYAGITIAQLDGMEPSVAWQTTAGATTAHSAISVTGLSATGYELATTTQSGTVYTYVKDLTSAPTVARTCGTDCTW
jgi:type IV pilus assembly protein PilA